MSEICGDITDAHMYIGWYNSETDEWNEAEPSLPAFMRGRRSD